MTIESMLLSVNKRRGGELVNSSSPPRLIHRREGLRLPIDAGRERRVVRLVRMDGQIHGTAVLAALEELPGRKDLLLRLPVLANLTPQVVQALTAAKRPERLLTEELIDRRGLRRRRRQRC